MARPMIRKVHPDDVNDCIALAQEVMVSTPYAGCTISKRKIYELIDQSTRDPYHRFFQVSYDKDELQGLLVGIIEPLFFSTQDWYVTDIVFLVRPGSNAGFDLMEEFTDWYRQQARRCPGKFVTLLGNSSGREIDAFYRRHDLERIGGMYSEKLQ